MTVPESSEVQDLANRLTDVVITNNEAGTTTPTQEVANAEEDELSKSSTPTSNLSQLEQLANTNVLTLRVKWSDNLVMDYKKTELLNKLHELIHSRRGFAVNPSVIENYEHLSDKGRLAVMEENQGVYIYESGTEEFAKSYEDDEDANWFYDFVIQSQFKSWQDLEVVRDNAIELLEESGSVMKWSVSVNPHALTHPGNLYIRGIPKDLTVDDLVPVFAKFGPVISMKLICDSNTGESLGYGFLSYPLGSQASLCIKELNGNMMNGSPLFINYHVERKERERIHWDHIKEDNDDERFRGVFIGNLPTNDSDGKLITPEDVISKFKGILNADKDDLDIISYYFPKRNSKSDIEYKDEDDERDNIETCESQHEESPLKGYGFIKFASHDQALKAIDKFNDMEWLENKLVVNKAVQTKPHHHHHYHGHNRRQSDRSLSSRQSSLTNIPFYTPYGAPQGGFGYFPAPSNGGYGMTIPASGEAVPSELGNDHSPVSSPSPRHSYLPTPQLPVYGGPPSLSHTPESTSAPSSRNGSIFNVQQQGGMVTPTPFLLPIPTKDQQESNLYVKHLPLSWRDDDLYHFYEKFGEIISAKIITVGGSKNEEASSQKSKKQDELPMGTSKGYGFVCFKNPLDASRAMMITDRYQVDENHTLYVSFAQKRAKSISNGDSMSPMVNSRPTSRKNSYHGYNGGQDMLGNYNPKFLNAMFQQQGGRKSFSRPRGSWPLTMGVPIAPPHAVQFVPPFVAPAQFQAMQDSPIDEGDHSGGPLDASVGKEKQFTN
ncbi:LAFE_0H01112g1_1 [Lachancea fermentati]|uniref:LAFE_0H01112g1_1 n=1 Tax=Lachancea fermentati TaxID=4955 RepID=A0A1G4MJ40_LACFM|nr:LAFE_0H01112g1_1 [Lachancea fermentati]